MAPSDISISTKSNDENRGKGQTNCHSSGENDLGFCVFVTYEVHLYRGAIRGKGMSVVANTKRSIGGCSSARPGVLTQSLPLLRICRVVAVLRFTPPDLATRSATLCRGWYGNITGALPVSASSVRISSRSRKTGCFTKPDASIPILYNILVCNII